MKKINFTIVLFITGFIAIAFFAAFNYYMPYIGNGSSDSIADVTNNSGQVLDIEDEKNNFGAPSAEGVVPISNNDSGQIGGASDTSGMLAVAGTDGEAGDAIVNSEQNVAEDSDNSDQTAGNDDAIQPFVWDNSLIAALGMPPGYRPVEIPFGINSVGRAVGYSGAAGGASSSGASGGTSSSSASSSGVSETASSSNESESTSSPEVADNTSSPEVAESDSINDIIDLNEFLPSDDSEWELILASEGGINGAGQAGGYDSDEDELTLHHSPEPTTILLFGSGLISLGVFGRRKLKRF